MVFGMHEYLVEFLKFMCGFTMFIGVSLAIIYLASGTIV